MHQTILVQRRAAAVNRIVERGRALAQHLELDPALTEGLQPVGIKDPNVAAMTQLEGIARLMDQIAENVGAPAPAEVDTTVHEFIAPPPAVTAVTEEPPAADEPPAEEAPASSKRKPAKKK